MAKTKTRKKTLKKTPASKRLARHRAHAARRGIRRVEVAVPGDDVGLIRRVAHSFCEGGATAENLRHQLGRSRPQEIAKTTAEFLEMSRRIIGEGVELELPPREYDPENDKPVFGQ